jgi:peptide/nickel transport system substrate-binding protein
MSTNDQVHGAARQSMKRRDFLRRTAWGSVGATGLIIGTSRSRASAHPPSPYSSWLPPSEKPPKRGGLLTRASAWDPPVLDPRLTNSVGLFQIATLTSNRLLRYLFADEARNNSDLTLKGDLAETWEGSGDFRTWTFRLRQGVKWHNVPPLNGRELVADDIKYCYDAYAKEGVQSFTFQEIEGMETPDKYTIRIHLKTPNTMFPQNVAEAVTVIFPREVLEEDGDLKKRMIGTGPFILKEFDRKVKAVLVRNPDYFDKGYPHLTEYRILSTPDAATRLAAFRTGQSDILGLQSLADVATVRKTNPAAIVQEITTVLAPFGLTLRQDKPPFNDVRVRRAISMAIDRQKQVDTLYEGHAILGWGIPYFYFQDERPTAADLGPYWQYRPEEAKKLLAEAGYPNGFKTTLFYYEYFPQMTSQIQLVQQDLKRNLNIELTISKNDYTTYFGRYAEGKWEGTAWGFQTGYAVSLDERTYQYMHSKSPKNYFRIADPLIDELTTKLRQTRERAEQRAITKKIVAREHDQVLRMWMPYDAGFALWQPHLRNVGQLDLRGNFGYGSSTLARLWLDK